MAMQLQNPAPAPVARLHIQQTDTYPNVRVEVLDGAALQPSASPVDVYTEHAPHDPGVALRMRRVLRLLGLQDAVPQDDEAMMGALFSVLGTVASTIERKLGNTTEAHEPAQVGVIEVDEVMGWHMHALVPWEQIGEGTQLYTRTR